MKRTDGSIVGYRDPVFDAFAIAPNDGVDLAQITRGIFVAGTGDIKVTLAGGSTVTLANVAPGVWPFQVKRVFATGTTASGLLGLV